MDLIYTALAQKGVILKLIKGRFVFQHKLYMNTINGHFGNS